MVLVRIVAHVAHAVTTAETVVHVDRAATVVIARIAHAAMTTARRAAAVSKMIVHRVALRIQIVRRVRVVMMIALSVVVRAAKMTVPPAIVASRMIAHRAHVVMTIVVRRAVLRIRIVLRVRVVMMIALSVVVRAAKTTAPHVVAPQMVARRRLTSSAGHRVSTSRVRRVPVVVQVHAPAHREAEHHVVGHPSVALAQKARVARVASSILLAQAS